MNDEAPEAPGRGERAGRRPDLTVDSPVPTQFHVGDNVQVACKNGLAYSVTRL